MVCVSVEKLQLNEEDEPLVDEILNKVTTYKSSGGKRILKLKDEYVTFFHPFYYYFLSEEQQFALGLTYNKYYFYSYITRSNLADFHRQRAKANDSGLGCPPPKQPKLTTTFKNLRRILCSPPLLAIMRVTLKRYKAPE